MRYRTIVLIDLYYGLIDLYSSTRCDSLRRLSHRGMGICHVLGGWGVKYSNSLHAEIFRVELRS